MQIQQKLLNLGQTGCLLLSVLHLIEKEDQVLDLYDRLISDGAIEEDCYVIHDKLASTLNKIFGTRLKYCGYSSEPKTGFLNICELKKNRASHFVVTDEKGEVIYDPLYCTRPDGWVENSWRLYACD